LSRSPIERPFGGDVSGPPGRARGRRSRHRFSRLEHARRNYRSIPETRAIPLVRRVGHTLARIQGSPSPGAVMFVDHVKRMRKERNFFRYRVPNRQPDPAVRCDPLSARDGSLSTLAMCHGREARLAPSRNFRRPWWRDDHAVTRKPNGRRLRAKHPCGEGGPSTRITAVRLSGEARRTDSRARVPELDLRVFMWNAYRYWSRARAACDGPAWGDGLEPFLRRLTLRSSGARRAERGRYAKNKKRARM